MRSITCNHFVLPLLLLLPLLPHSHQLVIARSLLHPSPCKADQASALLRLKRSFAVTAESMAAFRSWTAGTDCCRWDGVRCGDDDGRVTWLDLGDRELESGGLDPAVFQLTSLRHLNLGGNNFNASEIPSTGFERLSKLNHLNLSTSNLVGQVPRSIGRLVNLTSLDLSVYVHGLTEIFGLGYEYVGVGDSAWSLALPNLTDLVANLSRLEELHLGYMKLSSQEDDWCNALAEHTPNLRVLSLPVCGLHGPICRSLSGLRSLSVIDLQYNSLNGSFPAFFANFSSLSVVQLSYNDLEGWVPPAILQNKKLVTFDLHMNYGIWGTLPNFTSAGSCLEDLLVGSTSFSGTIPSSIGNLRSLKKLGLDSSGFAGELPSSIGTLRSLTSLQVSGSQVVGSFPSWISNLTSLEVLEFSSCGLYGPIPSSIADLKKLKALALGNCNFSGLIYPYISNLTQLANLDLHSNNFVGTVELNSLWKLPELLYLDLSNNKLNVVDGEYNSSLPSFPQNLSYLSLASCNLTNFPYILRHLNWIISLDLSYNQIHGAIPYWAFEKWSKRRIFLLNFSHNELDSIAYDTFLPFFVYLFDLSFNKFKGPIPIPQYSKGLDYSNNYFSSMPPNISTQLSQTSFFKASTNNLSGSIQPYFCSGTLQILDLSHNNFSGFIPSCLMKDTNALEVLNLKQNQLHGELPHDISENCPFNALDFSGNSIEGRLPRSLASCENLEVFDIGNNQISDSFPCWMSTLPRFQVLVLRSNKFYGQLASENKSSCEFQSLRILDLASNNFSGALTGEWFTNLKSMVIESVNDTSVIEYKDTQDRAYQVATILTYKGFDITISKLLRTFVFMDVSSNAFYGSIPEAIGELVLLHGLNMSHNSLAGPIPSQISRLKQLEALDLSSNLLSGEIPQGIASLDFLSMLNLSNNHLEGRIPESPHFWTFSNSSFLGNNGLCGPPLSKGCNNMTSLYAAQHHSKKDPVDIVLLLFAGLGFGVGFGIAIIVTWGIPKHILIVLKITFV